MLTYILGFSANFFTEIFDNPLFEMIPLIFLFVCGLSLLNLIKNAI